jgi:hypothetical protein
MKTRNSLAAKKVIAQVKTGYPQNARISKKKLEL